MQQVIISVSLCHDELSKQMQSSLTATSRMRLRWILSFSVEELSVSSDSQDNS